MNSKSEVRGAAGRRFRELAAVGCVLVAVPAAAGGRFTFRIDEKRDDTPKPAVEVHSARGRIELAPAPSGRILLGGVKIVEASGAQRAAQLARLTRLRVDERDDVWRLDVETPAGPQSEGFFATLFGRRERVEVDLQLQVPPEARISLTSESADVEGRELGGPVQVRAGSGDVLLAGVRRDVSVEVGSGDISLQEVGGETRLRAASGDVRLRGVAGRTDVAASSGDVDAADLGSDVRIETLSGDLHLARCGGSLRFSSASGSAVVQGVRGSIDIESASGEIEVDCQPAPESHLGIETASGSVSLRLQGGQPFAIDAFTAHGDLVTRLPGLTVVSRSEGQLVGYIGSPRAPKVWIRSASGSIRIWGAEPPAPER